jgi:hypothetical protein
MAQKTAVDWLIEQINGYAYPLPFDKYIRIDISKEIIDKAEKMDKEQTKAAYNQGYKDAEIDNFICDHKGDVINFEDAEQYYNETYGTE